MLFEQAPLNHPRVSHSLGALSLLCKGVFQQEPVEGLAESGSHWRSRSLWSLPRALPGKACLARITSKHFQLLSVQGFTAHSASSHTHREVLGLGVGLSLFYFRELEPQLRAVREAFLGSHRQPLSDRWVEKEIFGTGSGSQADYAHPRPFQTLLEPRTQLRLRLGGSSDSRV